MDGHVFIQYFNILAFLHNYTFCVFGILFKHFRHMHNDFDLGMLMGVCDPKRSTYPLYNFLSDFRN